MCSYERWAGSVSQISRAVFPARILETGLKFHIWTQDEIGPGNRAVTTDRRQFTLFYLFYFPFFGILFACLRFGSHFRSHDSHVTGEHMVELGGHFLLFFCKSKQFFNVHVHCILKVRSLVQVQEVVFRE